MKRREFIKSTAALATAAAVISPTPGQAAPSRPKVKQYRTLGKTNIAMSDISFGAGKLPSSSMILRAMDRGINYFDTSPDYGESEDLIGKALKRRKDREKYYIASKFCSPIAYPGHVRFGSSKKEYIEAVDGSLKRLGCDYLDVVFVHAIGSKKDYALDKRRMLDPRMFEAFAELKEKGKANYLAVSSHGPHHMEKLMLAAVESGKFDIIMPAFNFMNFPRVPELIQKAKANGVGVVAMKTLAGAKDSGVELDPGVFEQAAFKWVLRHKEVDGLVITIKSVGDLDTFLPASGEEYSARDQRALDHYAARHGQDYCRTGCGDCEPDCAEGVQIATILRQQMYFEDYGDEKRAMENYATLDRDASACGDCGDAVCVSACPHGLDVVAKLQSAHRSLTFNPVA
ncbi:MAG: aldo/keto reductase [Magnetococcales bacterium]|nr:aldo/keto reductase [Magnetococcales bacterium]